MKVYLVNIGEYSDRRLVAVYSSLALAEEHIAVHNSTAAKCDLIEEEPQEWTVDGTKPRRRTQVQIRARLHPDGRLTFPSAARIDNPVRSKPVRPYVDVNPYPYGSGEGLMIHATAPTEARALKAIDDRVARIKADWAGVA